METKNQTKHWLKSPHWEDLAEIGQPEYNIAIWQRVPDELIQNLMPLLVELDWPTVEGEGDIADIGPQLDAALKHLTPAPAAYHALRHDILSLAENFARLMPDSSYRWRFMKVEGNMCRLYHTDINDLRLLCTYHGPGTLWLPKDNINQTALRKGLVEEIVIDPHRVGQVQTGEVAILKGALHPAGEAGPIVHHSPSIEESGQVRILFRMDTAGFGMA